MAKVKKVVEKVEEIKDVEIKLKRKMYCKKCGKGFTTTDNVELCPECKKK